MLRKIGEILSVDAEEKTSDGRKRWGKVGGDDVDFRCAWEGSEGRCGSYGTMAFTTNGTGPWWCRKHFRISM